MSLRALFRSAVRELKERNIQFAVAGGFAADLYRAEPRLTMDVDLVLMLDSKAVQIATEILGAIGLKPGVVRTADLAGGPMFAIKRKSTKPCMVVGRKEGGTAEEGVDFLLPEIPWVKQAVLRAQDNPVDFGFGPVPALTVEDVVMAKLYAIQAPDLRAKDLDDLQSICATAHEMNVAYIASQWSRLRIEIPKKARPLVPDLLLSLDKDSRRSRKT